MLLRVVRQSDKTLRKWLCSGVIEWESDHMHGVWSGGGGDGDDDGGWTVKLLRLYLDVYNATKTQICKSRNRRSHGSAEFCFANAGNDISVTHSAQAEKAARQLRKGERSGREQPFSNSPAPHHRNHLHIYVPVPSFSNEDDMLYLVQILLVTHFKVLVASCMEKQCK